MTIQTSLLLRKTFDQMNSSESDKVVLNSCNHVSMTNEYKVIFVGMTDDTRPLLPTWITWLLIMIITFIKWTEQVLNTYLR